MSINQDDNNAKKEKVLAEQAFIDALYQDVAKECADKTPNDEQPSAELDQRILAAAHKAVIAKPQIVAVKKRAQISPWFTTVAKAASVILVVTLVIDQMDYPLTQQVTQQVNEQAMPAAYDNQQRDIHLAQKPMPKNEMSQTSLKKRSSPATATAIEIETKSTALRKSGDLSSHQVQSALIHQPILELDSEVAGGQKLKRLKSAELVTANESRFMVAAATSTLAKADESIITIAIQSQEKTARLEERVNSKYQAYLQQVDTTDRNNLNQQGLLEKSKAMGPKKKDTMLEHQEQIITLLTVNEYSSLLKLSQRAKISWLLVEDVSAYFYIQIFINEDKPLGYMLDKAIYTLINKETTLQKVLSDELEISHRDFDDISLIKNNVKTIK